MVQASLEPKKRGRPPLLSKPEVPKLQEVPKPPEIEESKPPVEATVAAVPKKRGRPPLHPKPGHSNPVGKVTEPELGGTKGGEAAKGTTSVAKGTTSDSNAVEPEPKSTMVVSGRKETAEKQEEKKVPTKATVEEEVENAVVDKKMETVELGTSC